MRPRTMVESEFEGSRHVGLHIEFFDFSPPHVDADVVVLAGDIFTEHYGLTWARPTFPDTRIVYVLGNREFYDAHYEAPRAV